MWQHGCLEIGLYEQFSSLVQAISITGQTSLLCPGYTALDSGSRS